MNQLQRGKRVLNGIQWRIKELKNRLGILTDRQHDIDSDIWELQREIAELQKKTKWWNLFSRTPATKGTGHENRR